jgi:hypothetical protein
LDGGGSTVLRVFFKAQYTVAYAPGVHGAFSDAVHPDLDYGAPVPAAPSTPGDPGYTFDGWSPSPAGTVTADAVYTALWAFDDPDPLATTGADTAGMIGIGLFATFGGGGLLLAALRRRRKKT